MQKGFTLLEVLVAFAIAATSLLVLSAAFSSMIDASRHAQQKQAALLLAESELASLSMPQRFSEGVYESTKGNYQITTAIERWQDPSNIIVSKRLFQLQTRVSWKNNGDRQVQLRVVRLSDT